MATLYELSAELRRIMDDIDECQDDDAVKALMDEAFAAGQDIQNKAEAYVRVLRNLQTDIDAVKAETERLDAMRHRREKAVERLKENVLFAMNAAAINKIDTPLGKWSIRTTPWAVTITDEAQIDARFLIPQPPKVDRKAILDEFKKTGEAFNGVEFSQHDYVTLR